MNFISKKLNVLVLLLLMSFLSSAVDFEDLDSSSHNHNENSCPSYEECRGPEEPRVPESSSTHNTTIYQSVTNNEYVTNTHLNIGSKKQRSSFNLPSPLTSRTPSADEEAFALSLFSRMRSSIKNSAYAGYEHSLSWFADNPRLATGSLVLSTLLYKLYSKKDDILNDIYKSSMSAKNYIIEKTDDLKEEALEHWLEIYGLYDQYIELREDGLPRKTALNLIAKDLAKNTSGKEVAYAAAGTLGTGVAVGSLLYYKDGVKKALSNSGSAIKRLGNLGIDGLKIAEKRYSNAFSRTCNWMKDYPKVVLVTLGGSYAGWLSYKAVKFFKNMPNSVITLSDFIDTLSCFQKKLLTARYGEDKLFHLIQDAQDKPSLLLEEKYFYALLSPKQQSDLKAIIDYYLV